MRQRRRRRNALHLQLAGGPAQLPLRQLLELRRADSEPAEEPLRLLGSRRAVSDQRQRRTLCDRPREKPVGGRTGQQCQYRSGPCGLAEHGDPVRVAAEPGDVVTHPGQRGELITQTKIIVEALAEVTELETT